MNLQKQAFTLVELVVVVTILAILSTIGFVSYSSYLVGVRDTNRISNMKALSDGLELYSTKYTLPLPDDYVEVKANGSVIAYQGYAGKNILETIDFSNGGVDPKEGTYYSYYLTKDKKNFQLMGFLEEEDNLQNMDASALDYSIKYPTVYGKKLGILTGTGVDLNTPIQEIASIKSAGFLDVATTTDEYVARFKDGVELEGTGHVLSILSISLKVKKPKNCKDIMDARQDKGNKIYEVYPNGKKLKVYCDMTTDGGGWTLVYKISGESTLKNISDINISNLLDNNYSGNSKYSDDLIKKMYYNQFKVITKGYESYNIYCRFNDINDYGDNIKSDKKCGISYLENGTYIGNTTSSWNYGFSTRSITNGHILQLNYGDNRLGAHYPDGGDRSINKCYIKAGGVDRYGCYSIVWLK